jgi:hypothetical protein
MNCLSAMMKRFQMKRLICNFCLLVFAFVRSTRPALPDAAPRSGML